MPLLRWPGLGLHAAQLPDAQLPPPAFSPSTQLEFGPFPVDTVGPGVSFGSRWSRLTSPGPRMTASFHQTQSQELAACPWNPLG